MDGHLTLDPAGFVVDGPVAAGAPRIAVVVSLWFPGLAGESFEIMTQLTTTAFAAVRSAGGWPVLIDSSAERKVDAAVAVTDCDGVLLLGGGDVDPSLYGLEGPVPHSYGVHRAADDYCIEFVRAALDADRAVLAICRGSQILNVACGGTLVPDITDFKLHRGGPDESRFVSETVTLLDGSRLRELLGRERVVVRSAHHQAVDRLGGGLVVSAFADDGVIEATQHAEKRWVTAVQWHPEEMDADVSDRSRLFEAFVAASAMTTCEAWVN